MLALRPPARTRREVVPLDVVAFRALVVVVMHVPGVQLLRMKRCYLHGTVPYGGLT